MSISVQHISKNYGTQKALDNVSFELKNGEIVGFLGPNGAGKSTMMKILTTYLHPTEGEASVNGHSILTGSMDVKRSVGYLPEHNPLYLDMYVREYLKFNASVYKVPSEKIDEVIEHTGLKKESHKLIGQLSKGFRQRVGLASALLHDPDVLILDEPTTGLDPNQLIEIRELIRNLGKDKTVLLSTHIMQEVEAICDRVIIINNGRIVHDSPISELKSGKAQVVEVTFDYRVETVALEKLSKLNRIENPEGFTYLLYFDSGKDMRSEVFDFAHDNGLKILELKQKNQTLEDLFIELTTQR